MESKDCLHTRISLHILLPLLLLPLLLASTAVAADIFVPQDVETIQGAIDLAVAGDRVLIAPGTYLESIDFAGKNITLESTDGASATVIDGGGAVGFVVTLNSGETRDAVLRGLTITGGFGEAGSNGAGPGGGILIEDASPLIEDCIVTGNAGIFGGGIAITGGSTLVKGTLLTGNQALQGAGICIEDGTLTVEDGEFRDNYATNNGGALAGLWQSTVNVTDSGFSGNASGQLGGAVYTAHATVDFARLTFTENGEGELMNDGVSWHLDTLGGGAIYTAGTSGRIEASRFLRNIAAYGSGIYVNGSGTLEIVNSLVADNPIGVPFWSNDSSPVVTNCTITSNQNTTMAIYTTYNATPTFNNSIITGNGVPTGGNGLTTLNYCLYDGEPFAAQVGPGNVLVADALLDPLADYAPLFGSPAIDAGDNTAVPAGITTDLLGNLRFVDDPDTPDSGNGEPPIVDIGAVEYGSWQPGLDGITAAGTTPSLLLSEVRAAPNPFNPRTEIRFTLGQSAEVKVDIYDARGLRVRTLRPGAMAAGAQGLGWDGADRNGRALATGIYLAVVQAAGQEQAVKLTLVR